MLGFKAGGEDLEESHINVIFLSLWEVNEVCVYMTI